LTEGSARPETAIRHFRAYYALAALVFGLVAGMMAGDLGQAGREDALSVASFVGT